MKSFILSNYDLKSQSKLTPLSNACNYRYATSRLTLTSTASSNRWNDLITLKCIVQEVSKLSTLLLIDKKLNNLQRVRYWKEDTKWFCKKSFNMSSTLWIISCDPLKASVCACVTYIACNVMLCQHIQRPPQRLPHLDRMTHEQGTNLHTYLGSAI